jgi:hypothetical protein
LINGNRIFNVFCQDLTPLIRGKIIMAPGTTSNVGRNLAWGCTVLSSGLCGIGGYENRRYDILSHSEDHSIDELIHYRREAAKWDIVFQVFFVLVCFSLASACVFTCTRKAPERSQVPGETTPLRGSIQRSRTADPETGATSGSKFFQAGAQTDPQSFTAKHTSQPGS